MKLNLTQKEAEYLISAISISLKHFPTTPPKDLYSKLKRIVKRIEKDLSKENKEMR